MSRYRDWTNTEDGIIRWLYSQGFELDIRNQKGRTNRYQGREVLKIINSYSKFAKLKSSYTERILLIGKDFEAFKKWIKENRISKYNHLLKP